MNKPSSTQVSDQSLLRAGWNSTDLASLSLPSFFDYCQRRIVAVIERCFAEKQEYAPRLLAAMRYAMLNGGKRLRPALAYATFDALCQGAADSQIKVVDGPVTQGACVQLLIDDVALALELLHGYSLVHDDLPAMDDDDLRRGQPTCHRAFDEATAILAGDALQSLAFEVLAGVCQPEGSDAVQRLALIQILAKASGTSGMAAGQALDLEATGAGASAASLDLAAIQQIHRLKTGRLLEASIEMAAHVAVGMSEGDLARLRAFGGHIGLAFQVQDDILDETGDTDRLGKQAGADQAMAKATYPAVMGLAEAKAYVAQLLDAALAELAALSFPAERLSQIARFIVTRDH